jgi:hypothetical protein
MNCWMSTRGAALSAADALPTPPPSAGSAAMIIKMNLVPGRTCASLP